MMRLTLALALAGTTDAVCNMMNLEGTCAAHPPGKSDDADIEKMCSNSCVIAMMGCATDSAFIKTVGAKTAGQMETLTTMCVGHTSGGHGASTNRPGDGKCDLLAIAKYHKQQEESGKDPDCGSNEIREEIDCIDDPLLAGQRETIKALEEMCKAGHGHHGTCLSQIGAMGKIMGPGGVCCPPGDICNDKNNKDGGPPKTCNQKCSDVWVPFMQQCEKPLMDLMKSEDKNKEAEMKGQVDQFTTECRKQNGH